jgi:hypothetical protein
MVFYWRTRKREAPSKNLRMLAVKPSNIRIGILAVGASDSELMG